ncbi:MAG: (Fe-S)-binding protein [Candidatus Thorarchaeota archaeon]
MREKQILGITLKCTLCGFCPKDIECPGFDDDARWESSYARGKIAIVHAMIQDLNLGFQNSNLAKERLFSCTGCGHCEYICPSGIDVPKIIILGKKKLIEMNNYPEAHKEILDNIKKSGNPFGEKQPRDSSWPDLKSNIDAETVYFPGCMAIYRIPELALHTIELFEKLGENIKVLRNETCCLGILYRTGHIEVIEELTKSMLDEIKDNPPKQIIFTCPGCLTAFKKIYNSELKEKFEGIKLLHFSEYLLDKILSLGDLKSKINELLETKLKGPIIWHDPCHLARGLGIYDEPRAILDTIKLPYLEFNQTKEDTNCCGSGSGVRSAYPELAEKTTIQRLEEIKELGAQTILTACPFCEYQFNSVIKKYGYSIDIIDLNNLLEKLTSLL